MNKSANVIVMFAFIPNSIFDFRILNNRSRLLAQIFGDIQEILQSASIADRSSMQRVGARKTLSLSEYLARASLQTQSI